MPRKQQSVVSLDPISTTRKRQDSVVSRLFKTRHYGGKGTKKTDEFGHYLFCGKQRSGKTVSMLWYAEKLKKKYERCNRKVYLYSNMGIGYPVNKMSISNIIRTIQYDPLKVHIILLDELHGYFPKDTKNKVLLEEIDKLTADFSQLGKRQIYVLSTAQVYGRVHKNLREQCLYMVHCRRSKLSNRIVSDFIDGDDIMCDELGRWAGIPKKIMVHGLPKAKFDTHQMIVS